jgi:hypothetical protein
MNESSETLNTTRRDSSQTLSGTERRLSDACRQQIRALDRQKVDTIKLTMCIVGAHVLLWAPFCVANLMNVFWPDRVCEWKAA